MTNHLLLEIYPRGGTNRSKRTENAERRFLGCEEGKITGRRPSGKGGETMYIGIGSVLGIILLILLLVWLF
jgi:hypothetical protein